jgi:hypothetical protein
MTAANILGRLIHSHLPFNQVSFLHLPPLRLLTRSMLNAGVQLNVQQSSPAEPVPSPPLAVSLPTCMDPGPRQSLHPPHPVISCSKPKQDLYRQVLISYLKKTAKGRAFYRGMRKSALTTVNSRTELKWMMAAHMPKKMSIFPTKQSAARVRMGTPSPNRCEREKE